MNNNCIIPCTGISYVPCTGISYLILVSCMHTSEATIRYSVLQILFLSRKPVFQPSISAMCYSSHAPVPPCTLPSFLLQLSLSVCHQIACETRLEINGLFIALIKPNRVKTCPRQGAYSGATSDLFSGFAEKCTGRVHCMGM